MQYVTGLKVTILQVKFLRINYMEVKEKLKNIPMRSIALYGM